MAPVESGAFSDGDVILNRVNVALAKRQGLLASLMGVASRDNPDGELVPHKQHQEEEVFSAEPELLGIGGKIPDNGEMDRQRKSLDHELKRQLLGTDYEKRQRSKQDLQSNRQIASSPGSVIGRKGPLNRPAQRVEPDSEDDAGRSSLGKRKRNRSPKTDKCAVIDTKFREQEEEQGSSEKSRLHDSVEVPALPQAKDNVVKVLAEQSSQKKTSKRRKKMEKKERKRKKKLLALQ